MELTSYLLGKKASGGSNLQTKSVTVTENGSTTINADEEYDGLSAVNLNTNVQPDLESKSITITENTTTTITPAQDKDGISSVEVITNIPTGLEEKDVNFYDYLGNLKYAYTAQEFQELSELPAGPTHEDMTFQEWNWQLAEAKTYVTNHGVLDIGETCVTSDGKTRIYIDLEEGELTPALGLAVNGSVTVDWGDNTTETITGSSTTTLVQTTHNYAKSGEYIITITSSVEFYFIKKTANNTTVSGILLDPNGIGGTYGTIGTARGYSNCVKAIKLGTYARIGEYAFCGLINLKAINIPNNITSVGGYAFSNSCGIKKLIFPRNNVTLASYLTQNSQVELIILSNTITTLPSSVFTQCSYLKRFYYPSGVTSLNDFMVSGARIKKIVLPQVTTYNKKGVLADNQDVKELKLPNNLQTISVSIFGAVNGVTKIEIPSSVTSIGNNVFENMWGLSCIKFLGNYTQTFNVGWGASFVRTVDMRNNTSVPSISSSTQIPTTMKIIVPNDLYDTWITTGYWTSWVDNIVKASDYAE